MSMFSSSPSTFARGLCPLTLLAVGACADVASDDGEQPSEPPLEQTSKSLDAGVTKVPNPATSVDAGTADAGDGGAPVRDAGGGFFSDVTANGTGCPAGTWESSVAPDGKTFRTTFSAFEALVDEANLVSVKDCTISIRYVTPNTVSLIAKTVTFGGWVYLEPGVEARVQSNFYFQGRPDQGGEHVVDIVGPAERPFTATNTTPASVKSRCGTEHTLNIRLTARLHNTEAPPGVGFLKVFDWPEVTSAPGVGIAWERCSVGK